MESCEPFIWWRVSLVNNRSELFHHGIEETLQSLGGLAFWASTWLSGREQDATRAYEFDVERNPIRLSAAS